MIPVFICFMIPVPEDFTKANMVWTKLDTWERNTTRWLTGDVRNLSLEEIVESTEDFGRSSYKMLKADKDNTVVQVRFHFILVLVGMTLLLSSSFKCFLRLNNFKLLTVVQSPRRFVLEFLLSQGQQFESEYT